VPEPDITRPIPVGVPFDPAKETVGLATTGEARFMAHTDGPPLRLDGYTVGAPVITHDPPHAGEMHPDGDEVLFVFSGRFHVSLELDAEPEPRKVELRAGDALVVPRGVWHLVEVQEAGRLVHVTPGPGGDHRPLHQGES
jgi:mannose-6-phosphate isomerase-like protein (cupin superfamily)